MAVLSACPTTKPSFFLSTDGLGAVPFLGGNEAGLLAVEPKPGGRAQPEVGRVLGHAVHHAGTAAQVVEEDVAALHDGVVQVHRLVRLGATEAAAADLDVADALDLVLGDDDFFLQARHGGDGLERRAWVEGVGQRLVAERAQPVAEHTSDVFRRQSARHHVGVEGGLGRDGEDAPGLDVDNDRSRRAHGAQGALDDALNVEIEGEDDVVARRRRLADRTVGDQVGDANVGAPHAAPVDHDLLEALVSAQVRLPLALDAGASDGVAGLVAFVLAGLELFGRDSR
jgi:hypothetical protein